MGFVPAEVSFLITAALVTQTVLFICGVWTLHWAKGRQQPSRLLWGLPGMPVVGLVYQFPTLQQYWSVPSASANVTTSDSGDASAWGCACLPDVQQVPAGSWPGVGLSHQKSYPSQHPAWIAALWGRSRPGASAQLLLWAAGGFLVLVWLRLGHGANSPCCARCLSSSFHNLCWAWTRRLGDLLAGQWLVLGSLRPPLLCVTAGKRRSLHRALPLL